MFIRGNVWGAPLSGPGNGPCNSDGGENAREIQEKSKKKSLEPRKWMKIWEEEQISKIKQELQNMKDIQNGSNNECDSNDDDIESIQNKLVKNLCFCMYPHPPL